MRAPPTVSDRIASIVARAAIEGFRVTSVSIGRKELDCLKEWCDKRTFFLIYKNSPIRYLGVEIRLIDSPSYFAYEQAQVIKELASA